MIVLFALTNEFMVLLPLVGFKPIAIALAGVFAVQSYVAPGRLPEKEYKLVCSPEQRVVSLVIFTSGIGLTVIVRVESAP